VCVEDQFNWIKVFSVLTGNYKRSFGLEVFEFYAYACNVYSFNYKYPVESI